MIRFSRDSVFRHSISDRTRSDSMRLRCEEPAHLCRRRWRMLLTHRWDGFLDSLTRTSANRKTRWILRIRWFLIRIGGPIKALALLTMLSVSAAGVFLYFCHCFFIPCRLMGASISSWLFRTQRRCLSNFPFPLRIDLSDNYSLKYYM